MTEWIVSSCILILIVIGLRAVLKGRISLRLQYAMWGLVLLRLLIPFSIGSTAFSVANFTSQAKVPDAFIQVVKPQENIQTDHPAQHPPVQSEDLPGQNDIQNVPVTDEVRFELRSNVIFTIWAVGVAAVSGLFLVTNFRFRSKLMGSRYKLDVRKAALDVYASGEIDTPCLFGIKNPAIYVTREVADNQTMLWHTLEHEATHYRHGDQIWAVLRCVCLAIHWYNPLVWWAAFLSQRDAELACDEATIQRLGEAERAEYGRTLIGMTCRKRTNILVTATTMTTGKSGIKERIMLIAKKPKTAIYTLVIMILVAVIAVGCTFTGAREEKDEEETLPTVTEPEQTLGLEEGEGSTTAPPATEPVQTTPNQQGPESTQKPPVKDPPPEKDPPKVPEPVNPMGITKIKSATLEWNGVHTVVDTYALNCIEKWLVNSRELIGGAACPFSAQLTLELEDGQTKILQMATDDCAACIYEGIAYSYAELTEDGYTDNVPFYSLFAPAVIREKSQEGFEGTLGYLHYLNWMMYYNQYGPEETLELLDEYEKWVMEDPKKRVGSIIECGKGLDGAISEGYGHKLAKLYELAPREFAWACLGNATDEAEERTIEYLAFEWNMTYEEVRAKLEAAIPKNG